MACNKTTISPGFIKRCNLAKKHRRILDYPAMKFFLLFATFLLFTQNEIVGNPAPEPLPDNDVHFHVNMPGARRSYPLKGKNCL